MKLLYIKNSDWEEDYIIKDLCGDIKNLEIEYYCKEDFSKLIKFQGEKVILTISINNNHNFEEAKKVVQNLKPLIIVFLSDESGKHNEWISLASYTKFFLTHYNHTHYNLSNHNNIYQIPLGYVKGMLSGKKSTNLKLKKIVERKYKWSFIGTIKTDRQDMYKSFLKNISNEQKDVYLSISNNPWKIENLQDSPKDVFEKYSDTIFVPIGRGNTNLDCLRIYETIISGAIPVIVGTASEINNAFNYNGKTFARIQAENWEEASKTCKEFLNKPETLQQIQEVNKIWWSEQIRQIRKLIKKAIN
jgi:hypothetical protein